MSVYPLRREILTNPADRPAGHAAPEKGRKWTNVALPDTLHASVAALARLRGLSCALLVRQAVEGLISNATASERKQLVSMDLQRAGKDTN